MTVQLMLVDDHPLVRDGLRARLETVPGLRVVAEADTAASALMQASDHEPDLVLMDIALRTENGIDVTRALLERHPGLRVLVLSMFDNPAYIAEAQRAGAVGYVLKDSPAEVIVQAIHTVMGGGTLWPERANTETGGRHLTPREREVLGLVAEGLSCKQIGERLGMGVRTVETHRTHLRRKLNLDSAAALIRYAMEGAWR